MIKVMKLLLSLAFFIFSASTYAEFDAQETRTVMVAHVIDGDTFVTNRGEHVRMLGINTPEKSTGHRLESEPFALEARDYLKNFIKGKEVELRIGHHKQDKFKRTLAHVYHLKRATWLNERMVREGFAHVYSFPDNAGPHVETLLESEKIARENRKGLWSLMRWKILPAKESFPKSTIGHFHLVEGKIKNTADVKGRLYLNFGRDWRTDFTVEIPPHYRHKFKKARHYMGKKVRVRGVLKPVNGVMVTVTHPEQIEFL